MPTRKPKPSSGEHEEQSEIVQVRITPTAKKILIEKASAAYLTPTAYHRQLIYQALGMIPGKEA